MQLDESVLEMWKSFVAKQKSQVMASGCPAQPSPKNLPACSGNSNFPGEDLGGVPKSEIRQV